MESVDDRWDSLLPGRASTPDGLMRLLLVLGLTILAWAYGAFWDLSVARYYGYSWPGEGPHGTGQYLLQHAILLPGFALAYYLASGIFRQRGSYGWLIAKQALLLVVFVCLVRPDLLLAQWLVGGAGSAGGFLAQLNQRHAWFHTGVSYSLIYFVGLCALFGLSMLLQYREQQAHAAALGCDLLQSQEVALARERDLNALQSRIEDLKAEIDSRGAAGRLTVKVGRAVRFMDRAAIESIEADGDYLNIHGISGDRSRTRASLAAIEALLPAQQFARIHRSILVNLDRVREVRSDKHGGYILVMTGGRLLATGAKYATNIQRLLRGQGP